jgi:hypothetical protein
MLQLTWMHATGVLMVLITLTAGAVAGADNPCMERLPADAARMYGFVKTPHPGELKWQQIPWLTDLGEAIKQAKAEGRPLLLFVSGDDPLEKC